ncbi:membrane-associated guanylate kinase, WW and PDZ domain-containing protein 2 isoform X1 [Hypanus sabinus]|uniref:membrane-associated guanylate kinase, WW and PDZ domain-containing protein 2 isoform X1 n=1 Tax=Hypanus sabinus TaxID=79690 RepID=UPI0028C3C117|nr:membrane-associated guanylate kinase, WW and PDZ domain-containing protein 2 isoform X1 [Hypanus sabinus]XP_059805554.1 membrane-associated guanylate kinase, WW and PDZ domain-containing protein 2 isoform X1 [Hypanus sabinus]
MLRRLLGPPHWTQRVREVEVPRDAEGRLELCLQGGAENGRLLTLGAAPGPGTGRSRGGELLLEVNGAPVAGLTLRDTLDVLERLEGPVHIKTVPPGSQLNADLRHFLKQAFAPGTADSELQETIRRNLCLRAVPCTTRVPREGEVPGEDYHFITPSEFQALDRAGGLLESNRFNGNYYGTPVPPLVPVDQSLSVDLTELRYTQCTRSLVNLEKEAGRAGGSTETSGAGSGEQGREPGHTPRTANVNEGPTLETGREQLTGTGGTFEESRGTAAGTAYGVESHNPERMGSGVKDAPSPTDVSHMPGHSVFTTVTKTNHTFGFTIAGGNRRSELLQIVSVAPGGPADRNADLRVYDVIVAIGGASVLGSTHGQVVRLFQGVAEGRPVGLHLRRGFPPLYDVEPRLLSEAKARAARASGPGPQYAVLPVAVMQSPSGPGFAVSWGEDGEARVAAVSDWRCCPDVREGDVVLRVNGQRVRGLSEAQLEQVLRAHTRGGDSILLVRRAVTDAGDGPGHSPDSVRCSADGSAQPLLAISEPVAGDGGAEGVGGGRPVGRELPSADTMGQPPRDTPSRRDEEGSRLFTSSMEAVIWDDLLTDPSAKWDPRKGEGRIRSRSTARGSSGKHPSGIGQSQDLEYYTVELERGPTGFGFSVRGGVEYDMDLYVLGMIAGGPAMNSGKIRVGDQLVEINGEKTLGLTHSQAIDLIKHAPTSLQLLMRCGNGLVPEYAPETVDGMEGGCEAVSSNPQELLSLILQAGTKLQHSLRETQPPPASLPSPRPDRRQWDVSADPEALPSDADSSAVPGPLSSSVDGAEDRPLTDQPGLLAFSGSRSERPDCLSRPQELGEPVRTRPRQLLSQDAQTQEPPSRNTVPREPSLSPGEESCSGTDRDSDEDGWWPGSAELCAFERQRLLNSLVGEQLEVPDVSTRRGRVQCRVGRRCPRCGRRGGDRLRPPVLPGPWRVPARDRLLAEVAGWTPG